MQHFDAVIFDVDGTLLDTTEGVLASVGYTIKKHGLPELSYEQLLQFIGPPIQNSFAKLYHLEGDVLQELATTFRDRYKTTDLMKAKPYEGIYETMEALQRRGVHIAVATYKRQDYTIDLMKHFGFDRYTEVFCGADHENKLKKKDIIENAVKLSGCTDFDKAVMVGDSDNDAIGAAAIGIGFIGVTYGFGFRTAGDVDQYPNIGVAKFPQEILQFV